MALDKAILHGKEHRKPYYRSGRYDKSCRPHGGCPWCTGNRLHSTRVRIEAAEQQVRDWKHNIPTDYEYEDAAEQQTENWDSDWESYV